MYAGLSGLIPLGFATISTSILQATTGNFNIIFVPYAALLSLFSIATVFFLSIRVTQDLVVKWEIFATSSTIAVLALALDSVKSLLPTQGWDVIDFWGPTAITMIDYVTGNTSGSWHYDNRHPIGGSLVPMLDAFSRVSLSHLPLPTASTIITSCTIAIIYGFSLFQTASRTVASLCCYVWISTPLIENHMLMPGYTELTVASYLIAFTTAASVAITKRNWALLALAFLIGAVPASVRNTGLMYVAIAFIATLLAYLAQLRDKRPFIVAAGIPVFSTCLLLHFGFYWEAPGKIGILKQQWFYDEFFPTVILFGGWSLPVEGVSFGQFLETTATSFLLNQSFSVAAIVVLISCLVIARYGARGASTSYALSLVLMYMLGLIVLSGSLLTEYGLAHALPGSDTGHSRFAVPYFSLVPLLIPFLYLAAMRRVS